MRGNKTIFTVLLLVLLSFVVFSQVDTSQSQVDTSQSKSAQKEEATQKKQPNILFILTDDQPAGTVGKMPFLDNHKNKFTNFKETYVNNAFCCPSRSTILSGDYDQNTGVSTSDGSLFDDSYTLATELKTAGYRTGLFGKYLNGYPFNRSAKYKPQGWDQFVAFMGSRHDNKAAEGAAYYDYKLSVNGTPRKFGNKPNDYSTRVLSNYTTNFLQQKSDKPFFAMFTPYGPHGPWDADPKDEGKYKNENVQLGSEFNKESSAASRWWRKLPRMKEERARKINRDSWETLLSEDRAIERFYRTLQKQGELDNTIIVFASDNGFSLGSHRWLKKRCLYDACSHVPFMIKGVDGLQQIKETNALVSNVDFAPTLADMVGINFQADGRSLLPIIKGESDSLERPILLHAQREDNTDPPSAWGIRTENFKYIDEGGNIELYNLKADPHELNDLSNNKKYLVIKSALKVTLQTMRAK